MKVMVLMPLFLQLLPLLDDTCICKYYTLFINLFTNINATLNLNQLLSLPVWCDYIFSFICYIREKRTAIVENVWGQLQTLLLSVVMSTIEKYLYNSTVNYSELQKDQESVHLLSVVFGAIGHYVGMSSPSAESEKTWDKGFYADFFILVVNRIVATLGMPGDKTSFLVTVQPVVVYLYQHLVHMLDVKDEPDINEVERNHYNWQLVSPYITLINTIIETIGRISPEMVKAANLQSLLQDCYTIGLKLMLFLLRRYNLIINDHCAIGEAMLSAIDETTVSNPSQLSDLLGGVSPPVTTGPSPLDDLLGGIAPAVPVVPTAPAASTASAVPVVPVAPVAPTALNDLLGGVAPPAPMTSTLDDLLGGTAPAVPVPATTTALDDLLGGTAPASNTDMFAGLNSSPSNMYVTTPMEESYKPLYNEAVQIAKQLKLLVSNNSFPCSSIWYLSRLNDALRTIQTESSLINADDFKATIIEIGGMVLKYVEARARDILKEVDSAKPKRKWLLSDKQKAQLERSELVRKELDAMLILPPECWEEKNTHLVKALQLLQLTDSITFLIDFDSIGKLVEASLGANSNYIINGPQTVTRFDRAVGYVEMQEKSYEVRCLKEGSHNYWRKHQITVKRWSEMVESLIHERGPWGELSDQEGILTLTARCNSYGMHQIFVLDPNGTSHQDASVWNDADEQEETELKETVGKITSLMQSSVEEDLNEDQHRELDQELMGAQKKSILFSAECQLITPMLATRGKLEMTQNTLSFTVSPDFEREFNEQIEKQTAYMNSNKRIEGVNKFTMLKLPENKIWRLTELTHEEYRLYLFRNTAVELFFQDSTSAFFSFNSAAVRDHFHVVLRQHASPNLTEFLGATPAERYAHDDCTRRWLNREISTFEYLMRLNRLAGRTYNDLSQYYVFPWVIADYSSPSIDLRNPKIYRDFNFPMGAQLESRREALREKFSVMKENFQLRNGEIEDRLGILCPPPRFFSTHYSNSANVLWYLIRLEPYTSLHIFLQDGKFDRPDRQFWSMRNTYNGCTTNDGDVKELIPEFYYLPQFLRNSNKINLGVRQDAEMPINDVQLPPWAKTPEEFVRINREALEGEFVSMNLHKWIDMVFGYKQRGPDAEACYNVFSHVSYYGALDMESLLHNSPPDWQQAADMLENFGQTPMQLMTVPHKTRRPLVPQPPLPLLSYRNWLSPIGCRYLGAMTCIGENKFPEQVLALYKTNIRLSAPVMALAVSRATNTVLALGLNRALAANPVKVTNGRSTPFDIGVDPRLKSDSCPVVIEPFSPSLEVSRANLQSDQLVAMSHSGLFMCVAGGWDGSLKIVNVQTGAVEMSIGKGQEVVTCVALSLDDSMIVVGSQDNSVALYSLQYTPGAPRISERRTLYGHDGAVTCVSINKEMDLVCSGSQDGTIILYSLSDATYLRTIYDANYDKRLPSMPAISWCGVTNEGNVVWYSQSDFKFHLYSSMGQKLLEKEMNSQLNTITFSNDRQYIIAGGDKILLFMMRIYDFALVTPTIEEHFGGEGKPASFTQVPNLHVAVRSVYPSPDSQYIFLGLENGEVCVVAVKM